MNAAIFWNDYTDDPTADDGLRVGAPGLSRSPCASQNNVGDADVYGVELEVEWHPTDALETRRVA